MKVILTKEVKNLGNVGDIKEVTNGYARNFLIPRGYAKIATEDLIKQVKEYRDKKIKQEEEKRKAVEVVARELKDTTIAIEANSDKSGKLYASVKKNDILKGIKEKGINLDNVDVGKITIEKHIKEVGTHNIIIDLGYEQKANVYLAVKKSN